jgi:predicted ATPase/DNA-binding SARP family transcriptional activator
VEAPWRIELLGGLRVAGTHPEGVGRGDRVITRFRRRSTGVLLAYLAFHRHRSHPRDELIELHWPDGDLEAGRLRLRVELSSLRRQLEPPGVPAGAVLIADRTSVRLNPHAVATDVAEFEAGLQTAARAGSRTERAQQLTEVVALYRGELLPGCFEDWVLRERERLAEAFLQGLGELIGLLEAGGDLAGAIQWARRGVAADPLREAGQRELIRLLGSVGQREAAERQYRELERLLAEQLEDRPGAETRAVMARLRSPCPVPDVPRRIGRKRQPAALPRAEGAVPRAPASRRGEAGAPPGALPSGTVTFLMTDIEGSTALWARVGASFAPVLAEHHALLRQLFTGHGGCEVKELGDGFLVAFERAGDALTCAVAGQRALAIHSWPDATGPLRVRMALHTGDVAPEAGDYHGYNLHHAQRLLTAGHGGQILCSEATAVLLRRALPPGVRLVDLGVYRLRDMSEPERLFQVECLEVAPRAFPPLRAERGYPGNLPLQFTRFFGREREIQQLLGMLSRFTAERYPGGPQEGSLGDSARAGRHGEALRGEALSGEPRLITLTGPGGSGKTRLALEVAAHLREAFHGAVWFVPLADLTHTDLILNQVLDAMRLPRSGELRPLDQLATVLADQPALLLLDNLEHLLPDGAAIVRSLLERAPRLTCLLTSRRRLGLAAEREFPLGPLPVPAVARGATLRAVPPTAVAPSPCSAGGGRSPTAGPEGPAAGGAAGRDELTALARYPSVQLFVDRAQAVRPDFQITPANAAVVAALCERVEGIPLALELAAARAHVLRPADMLAHLEKRFEFLVSRQRDVTARHRTLRATVDWSYSLLSPELQRVFARLSVFRNGWTLQAAEAICSADGPPAASNPETWVGKEVGARQPRAPCERQSGGRQSVASGRNDVLELLEELRECSLVLMEPAAREVRFRLLETLREYARECLTPEELAALERRHAAYYLELAEKAEPHLTGSAQVEWLERLEAEHENLRAVLDWSVASAAGEKWLPSEAVPGPGEIGLRLAGALWRFWLVRGYLHEGRERLTRLLALDRPAAPRGPMDAAVRARALHGAGVLIADMGDWPRSRALLGEALEIWQTLGDRSGIAASLHYLGVVAISHGDYTGGRPLIEQSLALRRELGDRWGIAASLQHRSQTARYQGDNRSARDHCEESLRIRRELGDRRGIAQSLRYLGFLTQSQGDYAAARVLLEESLTILRELGDQEGIAEVLIFMGTVARWQGEYAEARTLMEESLAIYRALGDQAGVPNALTLLGLIALSQDGTERAAHLLEEALARYRALDERRGMLWVLESLGHVALQRGDAESARSFYEESRVIGLELQSRGAIASSAYNLGRLASRQRDLRGARSSYVECLAIRRELGDRQGIAEALEGLAAVAGREGQPDQAACLLGAAAALREAIGAPLPPVDRADYERHLAAVRAALGEAAFASAWTEGRTMSLEQLIAAAEGDIR